MRAHAGDVPASDAQAAPDPALYAEAEKLVAELKAAAKAFNDIAAQAPVLAKAMFAGGATVKDVLAVNAQSETAQARLEKAFIAVKAGKAIGPQSIQSIEELATAARASGVPVKADSRTLEIIVKTTGALGGENFAVRRAPESNQKESIAAAAQAARDVDQLTKTILAVVVTARAASLPTVPPKFAVAGTALAPERDLQAEAQAAAAKAAEARKIADEARAAAETAHAAAARTQKEVDAIAAAAKRLQDQQGKINKLKARIDATGTFAFMSKIALTKTLIHEIAAIPTLLIAISKNPLATEDRAALTAAASKLNAQIRVMRSEMNNFIPDESRVRGAGAAMDKMTPGIDKLVTVIFTKAAGETGKTQSVAEDEATRAKASSTVADELSAEAQKLQQEKLRQETVAPPELTKPNLVKTPVRAANPAGRIPTFAVPGLTRSLHPPGSVLARSEGDRNAAASGTAP